MKRAIFVSFFSAFVSACSCGGPITIPCSTNSECGTGSMCVNGKCTGGNTGGGTGTGGNAGTGGGTGGAGGAGGGSTVVTGCNPAATDNATRDTDCDGLTDQEEYNTLYAGNNKTDPCDSDSDGDGIRDGVEMGRITTVSAACGNKFVPDAEPSSRSDPTSDDTDGDTLKDGAEDKNHDGKVDPGESNPLRKDSDCDGLSDPQEISGSLGCMTDPLKLDTDGDGLPDGVEEGLQMPGADPLVCKYTANVFDADATSKTGACNADHDGDGIQDGAEDGNHNGKVDPGELNPLVNDTALADGGTGPALQACSTANLKPVVFQSSGFGDVQVALAPGFSEFGRLVETTERGIIFYDPATKIAGLVFSKAPQGATASAEESFGRTRIATTGAITAPITQTFTTWDGFAQSVRATYDQAGNADVKTRINDIAKAFLGNNVTGLLAGAAGATGPYKLQVEYVHRTATRAVILVALVPIGSYTGTNVFQLDDTAGGSALAQFGDFTATTCEVFLSDINAKVDFLWVVDDSGSMAASQAAIANAAGTFASKLVNAGLDWRAGAVTTAYWTNANAFRPFTNVSATMINWFTSGQVGYFGTGGSGDERSLQSPQAYIPTLLPKTTGATQNKIREGAGLHLILMGDADDQSNATIPSINAFFANYDGAGSKAVVHGIVCPVGQTCNNEPGSVRNVEVIAAAGGIQGDFTLAQMNAPQLGATIDAILASAIGGTGHQLLKPPISSTIKIAIEAGGTKGACNASDIPRDRTNGFDFDSASRRIVFFGNCIPNAVGKRVAVSYRYWLDASPDPNGDPCGGACTGGKQCEPNSKSCVCPTNCGGTCSVGTICDINTCTCGPGIN